MEYLRGVGDAGTRLLFKFRSGTHGLNEELGGHRGREGRKECLLCDAECESVSHVLWDCPAYVSIRSAFMLELLGDRFEHFQSLDSFEKSSYVLGSEAWEEYSSGLLGLIKDFVLSVWEERKVRLYGEHANVHQSHSQNDSGDLRGVAGGNGECVVRQAPVICVMVPPIHLVAWSMALMLWLPFELLLLHLKDLTTFISLYTMGNTVCKAIQGPDLTNMQCSNKKLM